MYKKVYVEITNICNMRCSFCHGHSRAPRRMTREEFASLLAPLEGLTQYIYYHVMGEPLTHPQLPEFIALAGSRGFRSVVTTNGTLLPAHGEALLAAGVHKVNLSLHSFEEGGEEAFLRYVTGLADFARAAAEKGTIANFRLWNKGCDGGRNDLALQLLQEQIPGDWTPNTRGLRIRDKIFLEMDDRFQWPDPAAPIQGESFRCYGLKDQFGILSDGTVIPCCLDREGTIALGNAFREDLRSILASPRATALLQGFQCGKATEDLCKRCGYAQKFVK